MIRPCPFKIDTCPGSDEPVSNYSSEANDTLDFISTEYYGDPPPFFQNWSATSCGQTYTSTISQFDADLQAEILAIECVNNLQYPNAPLHCNDRQLCTTLCPDGEGFSFAFPQGGICLSNKAVANTDAGIFACREANLRKICLSSLSVTETCINEKYNGSITATGGLASSASNMWVVVAGALPPGLSLGGSIPTFPNQTVTGRTLHIVGTPTVQGNYIFEIQMTAPNGDFQAKVFNICVVDITPSSLPNATIGTAYTAQFMATSCANQQQSWQVVKGSLPAGLVIDEQTGNITGTPTGPAGSVTFTVQMQDFAS